MESEIVKPKYLYKILSLSNWQATQGKMMVALSSDDEAFIHLATEGQLGRIISKYWSNGPRFVILKVSTDKLEGDLRYEANPGGSTKYYHLYKGLIPLNSIVEFNIQEVNRNE